MQSKSTHRDTTVRQPPPGTDEHGDMHADPHHSDSTQHSHDFTQHHSNDNTSPTPDSQPTWYFEVKIKKAQLPHRGWSAWQHAPFCDNHFDHVE